MERYFIQCSDIDSIVFDSTRRRFEESGQEVEQLCLSGRSRTHDGRFRSRTHSKGYIFEDYLLTEGERYISDLYVPT